jgi:hypothetical protein
MGARAYELVSGQTVEINRVVTFQAFLEKYPEEIRPYLQSALSLFLDPKDPDVRSYMFQQLNAFFFLEASSLPENTLQALVKVGKLRPSFSIFVDTNFLFSILELHENPSNEAALSLRNLTKQLSDNVPVKLYAMPITIEEARGVLVANRESLSGLRLTPKMAEAALRTNLSGIVYKYMDACKMAGFSITPESYFDPYTKDLISIAKSKGVEFFDERTDEYKKRQDVVDDIVGQLEFEKKRYKNSAKSYEQLEHDLILYHFARDKRPAQVESPLEAEYWIVTVDYHFLAFDAFRRFKYQESISICLHPTTLLQMMQFWVPRTPQFEEAMLGTMRLPFLFQDFDQNAERATINILKVLGRFENIEDLSRETITSLLVKEALRQKLLVETDTEKQVELIREALIEEHRRTEEQLQKVSKTAELLRIEIGEKEGMIDKLRERIEAQEKKLQERGSDLAKEEEERRLLENRLGIMEEKLRTKQEEDRKQERIRAFIRNSAYPTVVLLASLPLIIFLPLGGFVKALSLKYLIAIWGLLLTLWFMLIDRHGSSDQIIRDWRPFVIFHKFRKWLFGVLGVLTLGVLANALWEWAKRLPH